MAEQSVLAEALDSLITERLRTISQSILTTEMGEHFDPNSFLPDAKEKEFTLRVTTPFVSYATKFAAGNRVRFDNDGSIIS